MRYLMFLPVPWVFVLAYLIGAGVEVASPTRFLRGVPVIGYLGAMLLGIGAGIAGWGLVSFYRARTTTVPGQTSTQLVTWGPYRFTRNPMYIGLSLAYVGEAGMLRQAWPILVLPLVWIYLDRTVIPVEEAKLTEVFGEEYSMYQQRVKRWI